MNVSSEKDARQEFNQYFSAASDSFVVYPTRQK